MFEEALVNFPVLTRWSLLTWYDYLRMTKSAVTMNFEEWFYYKNEKKHSAQESYIWQIAFTDMLRTRRPFKPTGEVFAPLVRGFATEMFSGEKVINDDGDVGDFIRTSPVKLFYFDEYGNLLVKTRNGSTYRLAGERNVMPYEEVSVNDVFDPDEFADFASEYSGLVQMYFTFA